MNYIFNPANKSALNINSTNKLNAEIHITNNSSCDSLPNVFQKIIDLTTLNEIPYDLHQYPNGDYLAIGLTGIDESDTEGFIMKFDSTGNIHWSKVIGVDGHTNAQGNTFNDIWESFEGVIILEDSTAIIAGQRSYFPTLGIIDQGFIIKIDFGGNIIWSKIIDSPPGFGLVLHGITTLKENNDHFFIMGTYDDENGFDFGFIVKVNSEDGSIIGKKSWNLGSSNFMSPFYAEIDNKLFFIGRSSNGSSSGLPSSVLCLFEISHNLEFLSSNIIYTQDQTLSLTGTYKNIKAKDKKSYIPLYLRIANTNSFHSGLLVLDSTLSVVSSKIYPNTSGNTEIMHDIHLNDDNTISATFANFFGFYNFQLGDDANEAISYAKLDSLGNILWHRVYKGDDATPYGFIEPAPDNGTMIFGSSKGFDTQGNGLYMLRTDSIGYAGDCYEESFDIAVEDLPLIIDTVEIEVDTFPYNLVDFFIPSRTIYPIAKDLCCEGLADADINYLQAAYPCGDSIGIAIQLCNSGSAFLPQDFPVTLYETNPTLEETEVLGSFEIGINIPVDSCVLFSKTILSPLSTEVFAVAGDPNFETPFEIPCDFPLTSTLECEYNNNIRSVVIPDTIGLVAFQDDYYLSCPNSNYALDLVAPSYLINPVWNGIYATDTLSLSAGGWYFLEAITPCGEPFTDSVFIIEEHPHLDFGFTDTIVCIGDTLIINPPAPFEELRWRTVPPYVITNSCPFGYICDVDTFVCDVAGSYRVTTEHVVPFECVVYDTFFIHIVESILDSTALQGCQGDGIEILGVNYPAMDTTIINSFDTDRSCDSTILYHLSVADTFYTGINLPTCTGDTAFWEGHVLLSGETQTFNLQTIHGCDSTIVVNAVPLNQHFTEEEISICFGETANIFGTLESESGIFENTYTAMNGCDSVHQIELIVAAPFLMDAEVVETCPDERDGQIQVIHNSSLPILNYEWNPSLSQSDFQENLTPGTYSLTLTNEQGCTVSKDIIVPAIGGFLFDRDCTAKWFIPNIFTPNGDGINDFFFVNSNDRVQSVKSLEIFTRWGDKVYGAYDFQPNDPLFGWDGNLRGIAMTNQVFVWKVILVTDIGEVTEVGTVMLNR